MLTPKEDYVRRDFTCNALYYDVLTGEILDFCNGLSDIQNKILNTPQKPEQTLSYDALRLLRLIRFSLYYNLNIAEGVEKEAKKNAYNMLKIKGQIKKEEVGEKLEELTQAQSNYPKFLKMAERELGFKVYRSTQISRDAF